MPPTATSLLNLKKFPLGRSAFALREVRQRALARDAPAIAGLAELATQKVARTMSREMQMRAARTSQFVPQAGELDNLVDYGVTALAGFCDVQARLFHGEERAAAASRIRHALLPDGVAGITNLPYTEQHQRVSALIERARASDLTADMALLPELPGVLTRLDTINQRYGQTLAQLEDAPSRQALRAERAECQELLSETVALILGHYALQPPERKADRDYLLEPIIRQNDALTAARRRRRVPRDVDPDTGTDLPEPPAPDAAGPAA